MRPPTLLLLAALAGLSGCATSPAPQSQPSKNAPRADATNIDGIYRGTMAMQLDTAKGKEFQAPAKLVFLPDGRSALLSAQHPTGVVVVVMKGSLKGSVFLAESSGRDDFGGYTSGMNWDVTFDPIRGTATIHGKAKKLPAWAHDDDLRLVFKKETKAPKK